MVDNDDRQDGGQTQAASQDKQDAEQKKTPEAKGEAQVTSEDKNQHTNQSDAQRPETSDTSQVEADAVDKDADQDNPDASNPDDPENAQSSDLAEDEREGLEAEEEDQPEPQEEQPQHYAREQLRAEIETKAGDSQSILGTTADATQLLLLLVSRVLRALNGSSDPAFTSIKADLAPFATIAEGFLDKVETGTVKMPALVKGLEAVVAEVEERSTRVASVIEKHKQPQSQNQSQSETSGQVSPTQNEEGQ